MSLGSFEGTKALESELNNAGFATDDKSNIGSAEEEPGEEEDKAEEQGEVNEKKEEEARSAQQVAMPEAIEKSRK